MIRSLKVYYRTIFRNSKATSHSTYEEVPSIVLSGKWLENAGFSISDKIDVVVHNGVILIKKV